MPGTFPLTQNVLVRWSEHWIRPVKSSDSCQQPEQCSLRSGLLAVLLGTMFATRSKQSPLTT